MNQRPLRFRRPPNSSYKWSFIHAPTVGEGHWPSRQVIVLSGQTRRFLRKPALGATYFTLCSVTKREGQWPSPTDGAAINDHLRQEMPIWGNCNSRLKKASKCATIDIQLLWRETHMDAKQIMQIFGKYEINFYLDENLRLSDSTVYKFLNDIFRSAPFSSSRYILK